MSTSTSPIRRSKGRGGHKWRKLQARVYRTETHCGICGGYVDQTLPWLLGTGQANPLARSVDHIIPLNVAPHLALARTNVQLAHRGCNRGKGTGETKQDRTPTSREW